MVIETSDLTRYTANYAKRGRLGTTVPTSIHPSGWAVSNEIGAHPVPEARPEVGPYLGEGVRWGRSSRRALRGNRAKRGRLKITVPISIHRSEWAVSNEIGAHPVPKARAEVGLYLGQGPHRQECLCHEVPARDARVTRYSARGRVLTANWCGRRGGLRTPSPARRAR